MADITKTYWKRKAASDGDAISGWCHPNDVPAYAEALSEPLPTRVSVTTDEDGCITVVSPPVIGSRLAYRFEISTNPSELAKIGTLSEFAIDNMITTQLVEGPQIGSNRENWWWYAQERFGRTGYSQKTPVSLMVKWKRSMLEILLEAHPQRDEKLAEWDRAVEAHKSRTSKATASKTKAHKKSHGDLVVTPQPESFQQTGTKQVFEYSIEPSSFGRRAKHSLKIGFSNYKTPHGDAATFEDGRAPDDKFSDPICAALALIAWGRAPMDSAHAVLTAEAHFADLAAERLERLAVWVGADFNERLHYRRTLDAEAAISALKDFRPRKRAHDLLPLEQGELKRINDMIDQAISMLSQCADIVAASRKESEC